MTSCGAREHSTRIQDVARACARNSPKSCFVIPARVGFQITNSRMRREETIRTYSQIVRYTHINVASCNKRNKLSSTYHARGGKGLGIWKTVRRTCPLSGTNWMKNNNVIYIMLPLKKPQLLTMMTNYLRRGRTPQTPNSSRKEGKQR